MPSPSPTSTVYDRPFDHRNDRASPWAPRQQSMYSERREHEYPESRHSDFQRSRDTTYKDNMYNHHSYHPPAVAAPQVYLPPPVQAYTPTRPYATPSTRSFHHASGRHHLQDPARDMPYGYNPAQESRFASHNERENGTAWQGKQFQPPPPSVPIESTSYNNGMRYQG